MPPIVDCRDLTYTYPDGTPALTGLDLRIEAGELVVLAGASGSGKSTLCRLLTGLIPHLHGGALAGRALVAGHDVAVSSPVELSRQVALVLQEPGAQCVGATVARDLALGPACQGLSRETIRERVAAAAAALEITHLLERPPQALSGGEQQRVALAAALAQGGRLLVLDEPFAYLDADGATRLRATLRQLRREGITLVVAEHRLEEIVADTDRLIVLEGGRVVADAAPAALSAERRSELGLTPSVAGGPPPTPGVPPSTAMAAGPPVLAWEEVWSERGGRTVLRGATLAVGAGELVALLGANGAGKTTLLRHANGLLRAQRGTVRLLGEPVGRRPVAELAGTVGLVAQEPLRMLFAPTVREEIAVGPRALGRYEAAACARVAEAFGLGALLERMPQRLSAGEQRRVALAAMLAAGPRALALDEPTAGQDAGWRRALAGLLAGLVADGLALIVATHDLTWVGRLGARRALLVGGRIGDAA